MRRREFITLLGGGAAAWPLTARAQQSERTRRIGVLIGDVASESSRGYVAAFSQRLDDLGWKNDRNIRIEVRWWPETPEKARATAAELISLAPDVMVTHTNLAVATLKPMAGSAPIVFVGVGDPVGSGFVASLSRPGANTTGFTSYETTMGGKWLEVLKDTAPHLTGALVLFHPDTPAHKAFLQSIEEAAPRLRLNPIPAGVHDAADIERAISSFGATRAGGIMVLPHAITNEHRELIYALALRHRLPTVSSTHREALVAYGADIRDSYRRAAEYVDRILRGEKAGDLPVQQPIKFQLIVNLKTAKALGLTVPETFLLRADEVIE
jgi:putative ABC transport system substrate-binding protein